MAVNTPGQSGQPGSPHYSDLLPLWDKGEYFPMLYSRKEIEKNAEDRLVPSRRGDPASCRMIVVRRTVTTACRQVK